MPRYRSSGWSGLSLRFVASLVVFAIAALSGAVIGGVSVYIINDAINPPPAALASTDGSGSSGPKQLKAQDNKSPAATVVQPQSSPKPIAPAASRTMPQNDFHTTTHAATQAAPRAATREDAATQGAARQGAATQDASQQAAQKSSSDALSRAHATEASAPAADSASHGASAQAKTSDDAGTKSGPTRTTDNQTDTARKKAGGVAKKRVTRRSAPEASEQAQSAPQRSYYDYYDRDAPRAQRGFNQSRQRVVVRRQDNYDDGWDDRNREADRFPAQSRPSFFGPFGGGRYNNRDDDW